VMGCCLYNSGHSDSTLEFKVSNTDHPRSHQFTVKFDPNGSKVSCSCKKSIYIQNFNYIVIMFSFLNRASNNVQEW
jgi:hypothetical protein